VLKVSASRNSFHELTKMMIAAVTTPGAETGAITLKSASTRVQPSTSAALSRSRGISWKKLVRMSVAIGSDSAT
jgi:hypothetical protein